MIDVAFSLQWDHSAGETPSHALWFSVLLIAVFFLYYSHIYKPIPDWLESLAQQPESRVAPTPDQIQFVVFPTKSPSRHFPKLNEIPSILFQYL